jgi:hypothetical protein
MGEGVLGSRVGGDHGAFSLGASAFSAVSARAITVAARGLASAGLAQNAAGVRTEKAIVTAHVNSLATRANVQSTLEPRWHSITVFEAEDGQQGAPAERCIQLGAWADYTESWIHPISSRVVPPNRGKIGSQASTHAIKTLYVPEITMHQKFFCACTVVQPANIRVWRFARSHQQSIVHCRGAPWLLGGYRHSWWQQTHDGRF